MTNNKNFKFLRAKSSYKSTIEAAKALEISKSMLYKIEQGHKKPGRELIKKMSEVYECSTEDIFFAIDVTQRDLNLNSA
jgi:putative transcriptional regulator